MLKQGSGPKVSDKAQTLPATSAVDNSAGKRAAEKQSPGNKTPVPTQGTIPANKPSKAAGSDRAHGSVLYQVVPDVSQHARETIQGTVHVNVKLHVDAAGSVVNADLENDNSKRFFADQAIQVARRWVFTPPEVEGRSVPSEWLLRFEFSSTETKVFPTQTNP